MLEQAYYKLLPIFESISKTFKVKGVVITNADGTFTLNTCDTLWLTLGTDHSAAHQLTIDGNKYRVVDILPNQWIKIKAVASPAVAPASTEFDIYAPHYYHGTTLKQNKLMANISDLREKLPMIWLNEITPNKDITEPGSRLETESQVDIFFLAECLPDDWLQTDHDKYVIQPMLNWMSKFIYALKHTPQVNPISLNFTTYEHADLGEYLKNKGYTNMILNDPTSGCQFSGTIQFYKAKCIQGVCAN